MDAPLPAGLVDAWRSIFATPDRVVIDSESGVCEAVFSDPIIFPLQRKREMARMLSIAASIRPQTVFEIGSDKAGSVLNWCLLPSVQRMIACEVRGTPYAEEFIRAFPHVEFLFLPHSSYAPYTVDKVRDFVTRDGPLVRTTGAIDVLFIDGDKNAFDKDFESYLPLMSAHGIVFMHDVDSGPMKQAFLCAAERYKTQQIIDRSESAEAFQREQRGEPVTTPYEGWLRYWRGRSCTVGVVYLGEPK